MGCPILRGSAQALKAHASRRTQAAFRQLPSVAAPNVWPNVQLDPFVQESMHRNVSEGSAGTDTFALPEKCAAPLAKLAFHHIFEAESAKCGMACQAAPTRVEIPIAEKSSFDADSGTSSL